MNTSRSVFIGNLPVEEALALFQREWANQAVPETIPVSEALGRRTAAPVFARRSSPHYHGAAMDGIALEAARSHGASETTPLVLTPGRDFDYVNTGHPLPPGRDTVIMIEDVIDNADGTVSILAAAPPWQHVRQVGEDVVQGEMIVPSGHEIRPLDLGALLNGGVDSLSAFPRPRVGILATGDELVAPGADLAPGKIVESNSAMLRGLVLEAGGTPTVYAPVPDDADRIRLALEQAVAENDLVVINAGSSAGTKDFTASVLEGMGRVVVHGVAMKPGKPTILGLAADKPVIGIPGYPVSAYLSFATFVTPLLSRLTGRPVKESNLEAVLSQRVVSSLKHQEQVRVSLGEVGGRFVATPLPRGAGATMSLVRADGILVVPQNAEGIEAGTTVSIRLMKPLDEIRRRLVLIGSHDLMLDLLAEALPLASGPVGSLGGILAMKRGECHLAPIHLLDETSGEYNLAMVRRHFAGGMALIHGARRAQGLMVPAGNPRGISGIADLADGVTFVNRQRGSGTRQLLDYLLAQRQLPASAILGYERERNTHLAVAAAVQSGEVDTGLGVFSAAQAFGLDFLPVGDESYEFLVRQTDLEDTRVRRLVELLNSPEFRERLAALGGYGTQRSGEVVLVEAAS